MPLILAAMDDLLGDFLTETVESIATIDDALLRWERDPSDRSTLDAIFRLFHTIKGTCGFLDLPRLEALAHAAETVLGRVRDGTLIASASLVTQVIAAIDGIRVIVAALAEEGAEPTGHDAVLIGRLERAAEGIDAAEPVGPGTSPEALASKSIRVPLALIERLMDTVSELVLSRNQLIQLSRVGSSRDTIHLHFQRLSKCITAIQDGVMRTRMQPIGRLWNALPRLVRHLSVDLGKRIDIEFFGGDVEVDRQMIELIKDPLSHMVRNAADHGIETPAERLAAGKGEIGRIRIEAAQEGGQIVILFSDDGRGLDLIGLRARAVAQGLLGEAAALRLPAAEAARLIFHPGLSTAPNVTAISGRGVGMDVVRANLEKIGGSVEVESTSGRGTRFVLRIPLTLAIIPALVIAAGGERFVIPQMAVVELVQVGGDSPPIERLHDALVLRMRDTLLPLVDLANLLGLPARAGASDRFVIVVQAAGFRYGLVIDELFDTEEIVVKPVAALLAALPAYGGNTVLGDGGIAMILDIGGIAALAGLQASGEEVRREVKPLRESQSLLLFRTNSPTLMAVPLSHVERIEDLPAGAIEDVGGRALFQYRGTLMPVASLDGFPTAGRQPLLVLSDGGQSVGLAVRSVVDVVEDVFDIAPTATPGRLGNIVVGDRIAELVDVRHYLDLAPPDVATRMDQAA